MLWSHKRLFGSLALIYGLLTIILVQGFSGSENVSNLKQSFDQFFSGHFSAISSGVSVFVVLLGSVGSTSSNGSYQLFVDLIISLAIIWALRQTKGGSTARIKDSFYKGMYPLVPFILVLVIIAVQLLPLLIGTVLYTTAMSGVAVHAWEKLLWAVIYIALGLWSGYMISSSIFGLYIVTLPDMRPIQSLRSAREIVRGRRWSVIRKLLFLPLLLFVVSLVIMLPIILLLTPLARWSFFLLSCLALVAIHGYLYNLYWEMIHD